mgnify:CR=1 FL=1
MKKIIAASILFTLFIGCVSKQVETLTTNYDNAGNVSTNAADTIKAAGKAIKDATPGPPSL